MVVATHEEACLHAKTMVSILETVSDVVRVVCSGWKQSREEYALQVAKVVPGLQTNQNDTNEG